MQDLRTATRTLSAEPTFTAIAVGSLAVGISMGVATATMVAGVRSRVLPFPTANRAVVFYTGDRPTNFGPSWSISTEALRALGARGDRVTAVGARLLAIGTLGTDARATVATGDIVTPSFTAILGIRPLLGRSFGPADADPHAPGVLMLEQRFWIAKFGGDTSIIGRPLLLNGKTYTVIGIYPQDQQLDQRTAFLAAKSLTSMIADSQTTVLGMALLAPGATVAGVNAELSAIVRRDASHRVRYGAGRLREYLATDLRGALLFLTIVGTLVAIIAGVNFATLVLGRGMQRRKELGIRAALGASAPRLVLHMLAECALLSVAGGLVGSMVAPVVIHVLSAFIPQLVPPWLHVAWTARTAFTAVALAMAIGLVFGLAPAVELARPAVSGFLHGGSDGDAGARRQRAGRRLLVTFEVGLTIWAIVAAGGMSGVGLLEALGDPGFDQANRFTGTVGFVARDTVSHPKRARSLLLGAIRRAPGVLAAGVSQAVYVNDIHADMSTPIGEPSGVTRVRAIPDFGGVWIRVSPGFFRARGLHLIAGRFPTDDEMARAEPVAVVTANVVEYAVGDTVTSLGVRLRVSNVLGATATVVGVVADLREDLRGDKPFRRVYTPYFPEGAAGTAGARRLAAGGDWRNVWILGTSSSRRITADVAAALTRYDPDAIVADLEPISKQSAAEMRQFLLLVALGAGLFAIALGLASLGIYGIVAYSAATRRKEMAVRFALGAMRSQVGLLVVREAATQVGIGLAVGIIGGLLTAQQMAPQSQPRMFLPASVIAAAVIALAITLLAASVAPVRRVWRTNPATVLREDG